MASARGPQRTEAAQELLDPARRMCWRVPELALMLSDRAAAHARRTADRDLYLRAEAMALFAANRLGHGVSMAARAIAAVREAEAAGDDISADLRVELADCARSAGSHEIGLRVLEPVLERDGIEPTVRAHALLELAASLSLRRDNRDCAAVLDEAERLYSSAQLNQDTSHLLRARVCVARACQRRRDGDFAAAVEAAAAGLELLRTLTDPAADSGEVRARLTLEQVHSLLDLGRRAEAVEAAEPVLRAPIRAAAAGPSGWLRLALATRIHLPEGNYGAVVLMLNEAVAHAERYRLDGLLAEVLSTLSHVQESGADFVEALRCLRQSCAADRRWRAAVQAARLRLLEELPALTGEAATASSRSERSEPARLATPASRPDRHTRPERHSADQPARESRAASAAPEPAEVGNGSTEDSREAARRLIEALTNRAAQRDDEAEHAGASASEAAAGDAPHRHRAKPAKPAEPAEPASSAEFAANATSSVADWTSALPKLNLGRRSSRDEPGSDILDAAYEAAERDGAKFRAARSESNRPHGRRAASSSEPVSFLNSRFHGAEADAEDSSEPALPRRRSGSRRRGWSDPDAEPAESADNLPDLTAIIPAVAGTPEEQPEHESWGDDPSDEADDRAEAQPGRPSSTSQTLAEIRASLQRMEERARLRSVRPESASPAEDESRSWSPDFDQDATPDAASDTTDAGTDAGEDALLGQSALFTELDKEKAGLAELLTEALVAYESGQRNDQGRRRRRVDKDTGDRQDSARDRPALSALPFPDSSTEDSEVSRPRHRRAAREKDAADQARWDSWGD